MQLAISNKPTFRHVLECTLSLLPELDNSTIWCSEYFQLVTHLLDNTKLAQECLQHHDIHQLLREQCRRLLDLAGDEDEMEELLVGHLQVARLLFLIDREMDEIFETVRRAKFSEKRGRSEGFFPLFFVQSFPPLL